MSDSPSKKKKDEKEPDRVLLPGRPELERCDNKVVSARYTLLNFLPVAIVQQFRRFANMYFLVVGGIMAVGQYTAAFETAISPWTTLGPLAVVVAFSLCVEGFSDYKRHINDQETNNAPCTILRRSDELKTEEKAERDDFVLKGKNVPVNISKAYFSAKAGREDSSKNLVGASAPNYVDISFQRVRRMDIRQGNFVLVKNREMVPADVVLLASSNDQGGAYIETSSIDGETNLKLRNSPQLPKEVLQSLREGTPLKLKSVEESHEVEDPTFETISAATKRLTRFSCLGRPDGTSALEHPSYENITQEGTRRSVTQRKGYNRSNSNSNPNQGGNAESAGYVSALTTEPPNASVHTFSGKLTLPPGSPDDVCHDIPLGAENILLRGAVLRNTEWAIGVACFTGSDTKLILNSFQTPSKFSQLDHLMNQTVIVILVVMWICVCYLATMANSSTKNEFDDLFYAGYNRNATAKWPYLEDLEAPEWETESYSWLQFFFLYITLLNNFVPLSLYITIEFVTICSLWFIYADLDMYDDTTDTRAVARSTIITDLGRIQYIFSDKTGTLTQNVMRFKRCSVDGMVFGAPVQKSRPTQQADDEEDETPFHPLRQLLVGRFSRPRLPGLEKYGDVAGRLDRDDKLTFNSEMFLRVMCLCHTVVVEKDIDQKDNIDSGMSVTSSKSGRSVSSQKRITLFGRKRADTGGSGMGNVGSPLSAVREDLELDNAPMRERTATDGSFAPGQYPSNTLGAGGAPYGYAYQAESPDEGALVSAASSNFGFQVVGRDTSGIKLRVCFPSHLREQYVQEGLRNNSLTMNRLAAETAVDTVEPGKSEDAKRKLERRQDAVDETWTILAVNKFDSDRKRMSVLLRSPPELGNLPILFCKGADSAMLDPSVTDSAQVIQDDGEMSQLKNIPKPSSIHERGRENSALSAVSEDAGNGNDDGEAPDEAGWEMAQMLGLQLHLGDFAKEGLRTLVLGMRVLSESECEKWLVQYNAATTAMKDRDRLLTEAALEIEKNLHVVGATAIEDKLQKQVPETIATLGKAGIKLWVLTGDKRETAIEIGYSTNVLTPKMHLTEVPDNGADHVKTQMAMEFIRLVKMGRLRDYQKGALKGDGPKTMKSRLEMCAFSFGKLLRSINRSLLSCTAAILSIIGIQERAERMEEAVAEGLKAEERIVETTSRRRLARERADALIQNWLKTTGGNRKQKNKDANASDDDLSLASEETPGVFNRASSARNLLKSMRKSGGLSQSDLRAASLASLTAQQMDGEEPVVDEDTLSLDSFFPGATDDLKNDFDRKKRTLLERMFAIDREVRKGRLRKHLSNDIQEKLKDAPQPSEVSMQSTGGPNAISGPRALVIEGAALKHLLGDPELEEILFSVASQCDAVIACRVSPRQKALLVNLVRVNVKPEPITLAIGDGANDVGMIQEAHVGVGISGKEGKQAVNASDFAIAQFRFLRDLILIHGRWDFFRLSTVVLYSFYKNAIMAGVLIVYASRTVYSGTPLFDEWVIAMLNFVAGIPIIMIGLFDRCLSKEYVRNNPEVYKATRQNELITFRTLARWICLVFVHVLTLFYFTVPQQSYGGGITPAWYGLMRNEDPDTPGEGEGGDIKSVGTVTFTSFVILLAYKVLFESRSLVHGRWPPFTCSKEKGEGFFSRLPYTWLGVSLGSVFFYLGAIGFYQIVARFSDTTLAGYTDAVNHALGTRSLSWILMLFVPIIGMIFDVCGKVFSNMYYPTQTQIHLEIESESKIKAHRRRIIRQSHNWDRQQNEGRAAELDSQV